MHVELAKEHAWLEKLTGEWTFETECSMGPDEPAMKHTGREKVRSLGGAWMLCEGQGEMPGGGIGYTIMTLGYDSAKGRFVGTFIGSMMTHMWIYEGTLDAAEKVLTLDTEGPDFATPGQMLKYQDIIEIVSDDHRTLSSRMFKDGRWFHFMTGHYRRVK